MRSIIYPGSFDPLTNGHLDLIKRACKSFDKIIVAVVQNLNKKSFLSVQTRLKLLKECTKDLKQVEIDSFNGLLVDFAEKLKIKTILRGLRAVSDFEYEFTMATMNKKLDPNFETIFMMTAPDHFYVSSKLVREIAGFGRDISNLVPKSVQQALAKRI